MKIKYTKPQLYTLSFVNNVVIGVCMDGYSATALPFSCAKGPSASGGGCGEGAAAAAEIVA